MGTCPTSIVTDTYLTDDQTAYDGDKFVQDVQSLLDRIAPYMTNGSAVTVSAGVGVYYSLVDLVFDTAPIAGADQTFLGILTMETGPGEQGRVQGFGDACALISGTAEQGSPLIPDTAGALVVGDKTSSSDKSGAVAYALEAGTDTTIAVRIDSLSGLMANVTSGEYSNACFGTTDNESTFDALVAMIADTAWTNVAVDGTGTGIALVCGDVIVPMSDGTTEIWTTEPNAYKAANVSYSQIGTVMVAMDAIASAAVGCMQKGATASVRDDGTSALGAFGFDSADQLVTGGNSPTIGTVINITSAGCQDVDILLDTSVSGWGGASGGTVVTGYTPAELGTDDFYDVDVNTNSGNAITGFRISHPAGTFAAGSVYYVEFFGMPRESGDLPLDDTVGALTPQFEVYINTNLFFSSDINLLYKGSTMEWGNAPKIGFTVDSSGNLFPIGGEVRTYFTMDGGDELIALSPAVDVSTDDLDIEILMYHSGAVNAGVDFRITKLVETIIA